MTALALIAALVLEQARALAARNRVHDALIAYAKHIERSINAGTRRQGALAWGLVVVPVAGATLAVSAYLGAASPALGLIFEVGIVYLTMGFRQFSHAYSDTLDALRSGDIERARANIASWTRRPADALQAQDVARIAIERGLVSAHRHVFGVLAWFAVFGPAGAICYRLAAMLDTLWGHRDDPDDVRFGDCSRIAFRIVDWIPARLTGVSFAVVGDFEDALYCWRTQAGSWQDASDGVVLACGAGAVGVKLGATPGVAAPMPGVCELGTGDDPDPELMTSAIGLVWRALVLWLFLIVVFSAATWLA